MTPVSTPLNRRQLLVGAAAVALSSESALASMSGMSHYPPTVTRRDLTEDDVKQWMKDLSNCGRWGADDQVGTVNLITDAKRRQAAALVKDGASISLALDADIPDEGAEAPPPQPGKRSRYSWQHVIMRNGVDMKTPSGYAVDTCEMSFHGNYTTHFDALSHFIFEGHIYNGFPAASITKWGATKNDVMGYKDGILTRGILVDIPALKGVPYLGDDEAIFPEDLEAWERKSGVKIGSGDAVLVRTGRWARVKEKEPLDLNVKAPGLYATCVKWLKNRYIAVLGSDGVQDVRPPRVEGVNQSIHEIFLVATGTPLFDNCDLEQPQPGCAAEEALELHAECGSAAGSGRHGITVQSHHDVLGLAALSHLAVTLCIRRFGLRLIGLTIAFALAAPALHAQGAGSPPAQSPRPVRTLGEQGGVPPTFAQTCSLCHGDDARGTDRGSALAGNAELRNMSDPAITDIIRNGHGNMPAFPLPADELQTLTRYIRSLNPSGTNASAGGSASTGESLFFGSAGCSSCHAVRGRGGVNGPDLSEIGKKLSAVDMSAALTDPSARIAAGYGMVTVTLKDGKKLSGFARARGAHDLVLQTSDGKLHSLLESQYQAIAEDKVSAMPAFHGAEQEQHDLLAFLNSLKSIEVGALKEPQKPVSRAEMDAITQPKPGEWPTYNGKLDGNRYSPLAQITLKNVSKLQLAWIYTIPFFGLETTSIVIDGIMYVTGNNQVYALDARTGREIWRYERPKSVSSGISSDAAIGVNRGVAVLGDRVFYGTDDAHLLALNAVTGALLWDVATPMEPGRYGSTAAPLVVGDLVYTGVGGADDGMRGFIAAYKATTGELVWRTLTIPKAGEPGSETWQGTAPRSGGSTWLTGSYDVASKTLFWSVGNPYPDTDGDQRLGSNLYTESDLALDPLTGKILWSYQYTPHDLHDWDANQPIVLVDTKWKGQNRKLLLHANRNGFLYVLDRTTGKPLLASKMVDRLNWASGINPADWTPELLPANENTTQGTKGCPAVRGATNWYSTSWNPASRLYYVMTVEDCSTYRKAQNGGFGRFSDPAEPPQKILRAFDIETGKAKWQLPFTGPMQMNYSGVLSTAGDLLFFGDNTGGFNAVEATRGAYVWHFETNRAMKSSPMTYMIGGRQYVAIAAGANILTFALPE